MSLITGLENGLEQLVELAMELAMEWNGYEQHLLHRLCRGYSLTNLLIASSPGVKGH